MAGPSAAATRSCSPELGVTRRPCRGLLEAALQHVAAFQEIRRRQDWRSRPRSRAPARPGRPLRRQPGGMPCAIGERNAGRAPVQALRQRVYRVRGLTLLIGPFSTVPHSGTLVGISAPCGVPRSPAGHQRATRLVEVVHAPLHRMHIRLALERPAGCLTILAAARAGKLAQIKVGDLECHASSPSPRPEGASA